MSCQKRLSSHDIQLRSEPSISAVWDLKAWGPSPGSMAELAYGASFVADDCVVRSVHRSGAEDSRMMMLSFEGELVMPVTPIPMARNPHKFT